MRSWLTIILTLPGLLAVSIVKDKMNLGPNIGELAGFVTMIVWWSFLAYLVLQAAYMVIL